MVGQETTQDEDREWLVACYDLLGIKREMCTWQNPNETTKKIALLRNKLANELIRAIDLNSASYKRVDDSFAKPGWESPHAQEALDCEWMVFGFADTMVIASPIINRYGQHQAMGVNLLLWGSKVIMQELLEKGILLRAGVEVGKARKIHTASDYFEQQEKPPATPKQEERRTFEGDLAGPAYVGAHELASRSGSPPGFYLGRSAKALLEEAKAGIKRFARNSRAEASDALGLLMCLDSKCQYGSSESGDTHAIDFAETISAPGDTEAPGRLRIGYNWVLDELKKDLTDSVRQKLQWLKNYLESRGIGGGRQ